MNSYIYAHEPVLEQSVVSTSKLWLMTDQATIRGAALRHGIYHVLISLHCKGPDVGHSRLTLHPRIRIFSPYFSFFRHLQIYEILSCPKSCVFWRSKALANSALSRLPPIIPFPTQYFRTLGQVKRSHMKISSVVLGKTNLATTRSSFVENKRPRMA